MRSIIEPRETAECYACGAMGYLEEHHIFFGNPNRSKSEKTGLKVHLCVQCHRGSRTGVHEGNTYLDTRLKREAQAIFEIRHSRKAFYKIFGKYYLEEVENMNKAIIMGRLTRDPEVRYSQGDRPTAIARYTLAVDRRGGKSQGVEQTADFINVVAFDKAGEFAEKYFQKGTKIVVTGRIQTGSYTNKEGKKVYTTEVIAEDQEFAESKAAAGDGSRSEANQPSSSAIGEGFMNIPDGVEEDGFPFT